MKTQTHKTVSVRLCEAEYRALQAQAEKEYSTMSSVLRRLINGYLQEVQKNGYVYIECRYTKSEFSTRLVENEWSTSTNESTIITYQLLDAETAEKIYSDLEQLNSNL